MAPVIATRLPTTGRVAPQVGLRPQVNRPSAPNRSVRAFGFFDDLKKTASSVTDKLQSAAKDVTDLAGKAGDEAESTAENTAKDVATDAADKAEKVGDKTAEETSKAADAVKDAAEK